MTTLTQVGHVTAPDGTQLAYRERPGSSSVTLVLLHSLGADSLMWTDCLDELPSHLHVLLPDTRGHGATRPGANASVPTWVDDLHAVLTGTGTGPAVLAGISMGGIIALGYAATHPADVNGLLVADSFASLPDAVAHAKIETLSTHARTACMDEVADTYVADTFTPPYPPGASLVRDALSTSDPRDYVAAVHACFGADISGTLHQVTAPTHVLWGEHDSKTPRELSQQIVAGLPRALLRVVPDAGHLSNVDNPTHFAHEIVHLLDQVASSPTRKAGTR